MRGSSDSFETSDIGVLFDLARRIAARWTASAADAEDLAQEAIIRYLTAPSPPANPPAWFHVVIRRVSNRHRLRRAARESAEEAFSTQRVTGQTQSDLTIELQQLLACVNDRERRVFGLLVRSLDEFVDTTGIDETPICECGVIVEVRCDSQMPVS